MLDTRSSRLLFDFSGWADLHPWISNSPYDNTKHKLMQLSFLPFSLSFAKPGWSTAEYVRWWLKRKSWKWLGLVLVGLLAWKSAPRDIRVAREFVARLQK